MDQNLTVMEEAVERGLKGVKSVTGLTGGDAVLLQKYIGQGKSLSGELLLDAVSKAVATNEVNAAMGIICATPTAGSAGVVPGTLFAVKNKLESNTRANDSLFIYVRVLSVLWWPIMPSFLVQRADVKQRLVQPQGWLLLLL